MLFWQIHRKRRRYQTKCHEDPLNTQYKFYGAGLLSFHDKFPAYQREVKQAFSYDFNYTFSTNTEQHEECEPSQELLYYANMEEKEIDCSNFEPPQQQEDENDKVLEQEANTG